MPFKAANKRYSCSSTRAGCVLTLLFRVEVFSGFFFIWVYSSGFFTHLQRISINFSHDYPTSLLYYIQLFIAINIIIIIHYFSLQLFHVDVFFGFLLVCFPILQMQKEVYLLFPILSMQNVLLYIQFVLYHQKS